MARKTLAKTRPGKRKSNDDRQFVTALARGLQIIDCLSAQPAGLSGTELAEQTGLPQPTVWRSCHTMRELGYLVSLSSGKFQLAVPVLKLGFTAIGSLDIAEIARHPMEALAVEFDAAFGLAIPDGKDMLFIQRCQTDSPLRMNLRIGSRLPMHTSSMGCAYLAALSKKEREKFFQDIPNTASERRKARDGVENSMTDFERAGYVFSFGSFNKGYNTIGVPIRGPDGRPVMSINCGAIAAQMSPATMKEKVAPKLIALAKQLESILPRQ